MSAHEDFVVFEKMVPPPEQMIDMQLRGYMNAMDEKEKNTFLSSSLEEQGQARNFWKKIVADSLRGLIFTIGDSLYASRNHPKSRGTRWIIASQQRLLPDVARSVLLRLWPVADKETFLVHAHSWYVEAATKAPAYFSRKEWEFVVGEPGELVVRLTGEPKEEDEEPPQEKWEKAKVGRSRFGKRFSGSGSAKK